MNTRETGRALIAGAIGAGAGAATMFFLDPDRGRRRRASARDKVGCWLRLARREVRVVAADAAHHARGTIATVRRVLRPCPVDDQVLEERVRARAGHVAHPAGSFTVHAHDGKVILEGEVDPARAKALIAATRHVPGVTRVEHHLRPIAERPKNGTSSHRSSTGASPGPFDAARAEQALHLGDIDSDPRSTRPALDELGIRHEPPE